MLPCKSVYFDFFLQLKEQVMLLEAQLEKQSDSQGATEEMEQVCAEV